MGRKLASFLAMNGVDMCAKPVKVPYGLLTQFMRESDEFKDLLIGNYAKDRIRKWLMRSLDLVDDSLQLATRSTRNMSRGDGKRRYARDSVRKKVFGMYATHLKKAPIVRETLFEWFSIMRHSVKTRFPPKLMELKAKQFAQDYVTACLINGIQPNAPTITGKWLKNWQMEYHVSFRKPNRKYKVPKKVLEDRLQVFWRNIARVRQLATLVLGYDLDVINMDQSPFHMNEAGTPCVSIVLMQVRINVLIN